MGDDHPQTLDEPDVEPREPGLPEAVEADPSKVPPDHGDKGSP